MSKKIEFGSKEHTKRLNEMQKMINPFERIAKEDISAAKVLAFAFVASHKYEDVFAALRFHRRYSGGLDYAPYLDGKYFNMYNAESQQEFERMRDECAHPFLDEQESQQAVEEESVIYSGNQPLYEGEED